MGYENFSFVPPQISLERPVNQRGPELERAIREYLAFRCGMQEIFTYPWIEDLYIEAAGADKAEMLALSTPPAPDEAYLRASLIPGILKAVFTNLRYLDAFRLFEMTQVFFDRNYSSINSAQECLPEQARHLAGAFVGEDAKTLFREAKGALEVMHRVVQMEPLSFAQMEKPAWSEDKLWLNVFFNGEVIGVIGLLSPKAARAAGIKRNVAVLFELDVEKLTPLPSRQNTFEHLPAYPLVDFDLSIMFEEGVKWAEIEAVAASANPLIKRIRFIDEYRGKQIGDGKKSVTFRTWIGSEAGTLTSEQIKEVTRQIVKKIGKKFGGDVRGAQ